MNLLEKASSVKKDVVKSNEFVKEEDYITEQLKYMKDRDLQTLATFPGKI